MKRMQQKLTHIWAVSCCVRSISFESVHLTISLNARWIDGGTQMSANIAHPSYLRCCFCHYNLLNVETRMCAFLSALCLLFVSLRAIFRKTKDRKRKKNQHAHRISQTPFVSITLRQSRMFSLRRILFHSISFSAFFFVGVRFFSSSLSLLWLLFCWYHWWHRHWYCSYHFHRIVIVLASSYPLCFSSRLGTIFCSSDELSSTHGCVTSFATPSPSPLAHIINAFSVHWLWFDGRWSIVFGSTVLRTWVLLCMLHLLADV